MAAPEPRPPLRRTAAAVQGQAVGAGRGRLRGKAPRRTKMIHRTCAARSAAWVAVIAIGWMGPAPASGQQGTAESGDDAASAWTLSAPARRPARHAGLLDDPDLHAPRAARVPGRQGVLHGGGGGRAARAADGRGRRPVGPRAPSTSRTRKRGSARLYQVNRDPSYVHYDNQIWLRTPVPKGLSTRRTSLIVDPPNGRFPPLTPGGGGEGWPRRRRRGGSRACSTATRRGRSPSAASCGRTRARRTCRRPTTTSTRSSRHPATWSCSPS